MMSMRHGIDRSFFVVVLAIFAFTIVLSCGTPDAPSTSRLGDQEDWPDHLLDGEAEFQGLVVESVTPVSALAVAGLQPGDILLRWQREANPPSNPKAASGTFDSPLEWLWVKYDEASRGLVVLHGKRRDEPQTWTIGAGAWEAEMRPRMGRERLKVFRAAERALEAGELEVSADSWRRFLEESGPLAPWIPAWTSFHRAKLAERVKAWQHALDRYKDGLYAAQDLSARIPLLIEMGKRQMAEGDLDESTASLEEALDLLPADSLWRLWCHSLLSEIALLRGDHDLAEGHTTRCYLLAKKYAPGSKAYINAAGLMGLSGTLRHQWDRVEKYSDEILMAINEIELPPLDLLGLYALEGIRAYKQGDLHQAHLFKAVVTQLLENFDPESAQAYMAHSFFGLLAVRVGDYPSAIHHLDLGLSALQAFAPGDRLGVAISYQRLGDVLAIEGAWEEAAEYYEKCFEMMSELGPRSVKMAACINGLGGVALKRGELETANKHFLRYDEFIRKIAPGSAQHAQAVFQLGRVQRSRGDLDRAQEYFLEALEVLDAQLEKVGASAERSGMFLEHYEGMFDEAVSLAVERGEVASGFEIHERSLAHSFLIGLSERHLEINVPQDLEASRRRLENEYDRLFAQAMELDLEQDEDVLIEILHEQAQVRREMELLQEQIREMASPASLARRQRAFRSSELSDLLDRGTALVSFQVGEQEGTIFIARRDLPVRAVALPFTAEELGQKVLAFRQLVEAAAEKRHLQESALRREARALYDLLFADLEASLSPAERLLIIPDGPLHQLPFGALLRKTTEGREEFLVEWKPFHTSLSATVFKELKKARSRQGRSERTPELIAFGDPTYGAASSEVSLRRASVRNSLNTPSRLPYSRQEVESIAELFPEHSVSVYLGPEANETEAKALSGKKVSIVHFAVHGYTDPHLSLNSGLVLSTVKVDANGGADENENGLLQVWEIFERVRLEADLLVLSACESGLGELRGGEGVIGLVRAFQFAGARSVLSSLWSVADDSTSELMVRFYRHLRAGKSKEAALRQAQLELIHGSIVVTDENGRKIEKDFSLPFHWAAFQVSGDAF